MTFTGGLITDAVRAANVEGDGLTPPAGVGIWPAATNLDTNGGFETNTTGWSDGGGGSTIARSTEQAKFGTHSLKVTNMPSNGTIAAGPSLTLTNAAYVQSGWIYIPTAYTGNAPRLNVFSTTPPTGTIQASANLSLRDQWQRVTMGPFTPDAASLDCILYWDQSGAPVAAEALYFDGQQTELGSFATPYIETDGGTASRAAGRIQQPVSGLFTATQGWVVARVLPGFPSTIDGKEVFEWGDSTIKNIAVGWTTGSGGTWFVRRRNNDSPAVAATSDSFSAGTSRTVAAQWGATTQAVSANGGSFSSVANTSIPTLSATSADIGKRGTGNDLWLSGNVLWYATGSGTLTDADAAALNGFGNTPPTPNALSAALSPAAHPTSLWPAVDTSYARIA